MDKLKKMLFSLAIGIVLIVLLPLISGCSGGDYQIVNVDCTIVGNNAIVTWDTGEATTSLVEYGI